MATRTLVRAAAGGCEPSGRVYTTDRLVMGLAPRSWRPGEGGPSRRTTWAVCDPPGVDRQALTKPERLTEPITNPGSEGSKRVPKETPMGASPWQAEAL